ncbi:MAG: hypothetical protein KAS17_07035 [Victivallaceae bacterium]|nr:hypothetical protein [Victivallaceae bacterium]
MKFKEMDRKNKIIMISGISVASVTLLATIVSAFFTPKAPDPKKLGPIKKVSYMASKQFAGLPEQEKIKYVKSAGRSRGAYRQLSSSERTALSKNTRKIRMKQMKEHVNKFFAMSEEEQNKYLDERIAQRDKWRKAREARRTKSSSSTTTNRRHGNRNAWRQGVMEGMDSTTRARMMELRRRMRERRKMTQEK